MKVASTSGTLRLIGPVALAAVIVVIVAFNSTPLPRRLRIAQLRAYADNAGSICWVDGAAVLSVVASLLLFWLAARHYSRRINDESQRIRSASAMLELASVAFLLVTAAVLLSTEAINFRLSQGGDPRKALKTIRLLEG